MPRFHRMHPWATPVLLAVLTILLFAYSRKAGILTLDWLKVNKDSLAAISSLCSTVVVVVTGTLAYYRFFRGRTFTTRVELSIDVDVIDGPEGIFLHSVTVSAKNIGTVTIWNPQLSVYVVARCNDGSESEFEINQWDDVSDYQPGAKRHVTIIDSGETAAFSARKYFNKNVWTVTYMAILSHAPSYSWLMCRTVKGPEGSSLF